MGLRLSEGIDIERYTRLTGHFPDRIARDLIEQGLLVREAFRLRTTRRGRMLLNAVLAELLGE